MRSSLLRPSRGVPARVDASDLDGSSPARLPRSVWRLGLSLTVLGAGCSGCRDQKPAADQPPAQTRVAATVAVPPEVIHLSFDDDPGFEVPLAAADRFGSFNRLLPPELREAGSWASLELSLADGTVQIVESPSTRFGNAGYDLRAAQPGMKLVVFDEASQSVKANFGPLAKIHVTPTAAASSRPKPFPIVIDGKQLVVDADQLASQPMVTEPSKHKDAWSMPAIVERLSPGCGLQGLSIVADKESLAVTAAQVQYGYLRFNRMGVWMFSLAEAGHLEHSKQLRGVARMAVTCTPHAK